METTYLANEIIKVHEKIFSSLAGWIFFSMTVLTLLVLLILYLYKENIKLMRELKENDF